MSTTQGRYLGRRAVTSDAANTLDASYLLTVKEGTTPLPVAKR
ncbi:hypothetical protein [Actinomycetospora sp.]